MPSLEESIKTNLETTGFSTAIKVNRILNGRNWIVQNRYTFRDQADYVHRSLDFKATYNHWDDAKNASCELYIACHNSNNRYWVFYCDPSSSSRFRTILTDLVRKERRRLLSTKTEQEDLGLLQIADHGTPNILQAEVAQSYQIAFRGPNEADTFHEAQHQVLKAIKYSSASALQKTLIYPVLICDGSLFECNLIEEELEVSPIQYIRYLSNGLPEEALELFIDVMTLNYFPTYLALVEEEVEALS